MEISISPEPTPLEEKVCNTGAGIPKDSTTEEVSIKALPTISEPIREPISADPDIILDTHQKSLLTQILKQIEAPYQKWERIVNLIQSLKGTPIGDSKLGLFIFPNGKVMKIYYPAHTKGLLTPYAPQSLLRGLGAVDWSQEALIDLLPKDMQAEVLGFETCKDVEAAFASKVLRL